MLYIGSEVIMEENVEKISEKDLFDLEIAKLNKLLVQSQYEKAILQQQLAELSYKHHILQLFMKYGLKETDTIENGVIIRNEYK